MFSICKLSLVVVWECNGKGNVVSRSTYALLAYWTTVAPSFAIGVIYGVSGRKEVRLLDVPRTL